MSEETKKSVTGALVVKPNSDDRKPTVAVSQSGKRIIIKSADMKEDLQKEAVDIAIAVSFIFLKLQFQLLDFDFSFWVFYSFGCFDFDVFEQAFEKNSVEKDVAERIKKDFDKKHGPTWHCIVGSNFGNPIYFHFFS